MLNIIARLSLLSVFVTQTALAMSCGDAIKPLRVTLDQHWKLADENSHLLKAVADYTAGLGKHDAFAIALWSATKGVEGFQLKQNTSGAGDTTENARFEPSVKLEPTQARITGAVMLYHNGHPEIIAGDEAGWVHRIELGEPHRDLINKDVAIFPDADRDSTIIGEEQRVRISPRGPDRRDSVVALDSGNINHVRLHLTRKNERWLAVQTEKAVNVYRILQGGTEPLDSATRVIGTPEPFSWLVDGAGESLVVFRDGDWLHFIYPGTSRRYSFNIKSSSGATFSTLETTDGKAYVLLQWPNGHNQLSLWTGENLKVVSEFRTAKNEPVALLDLSGESIYGIHAERQELSIRELRSNAAGPALYRLKLKKGEKFRVAESLKVGPNDHRVAVQTNREFYVLKVTGGVSPAPSSGQE